MSATASALTAAGVALVATVVAGTVTHELSHALALRALRVPYSIEFLPARDRRGRLGATLTGRWATVRVNATGSPDGLSPWRLRVAALMPLTLVAPFGLVGLGVLPDPLATGDPAVAAVAVGWAGCALPSPQDFALVWHPEASLAGRETERADGRDAGG